MTAQLTTSDIFSTWYSRINTLLTDLGDTTTLTTTAKADLVAAINELDGEVGNISTLTTTLKNTLVAAINELDAEVGVLSTLTSTAKNTLVASINELDAEVGVLSTLSTTLKTTLVAAINELDGEIGDLTSLTTTAKTTLVAAINEISGNADNQVITENKEIYGGRASSTEDLKTLVIVTYDAPQTLQPHNSSVPDKYGTGKFEDNNSSNGGGGGALETEISEFLTAINRTEKRYGYEYFLTLSEAGNGTDATTQVNDGGDIYDAVFSNGQISLGQVGDIITFVGWFKLVSVGDSPSLGNMVLGNDTNVTTWVDDVLVGGDGYEVVTSTGTWNHIRQQVTLTKEYENIFPAIYANYGTTTGDKIAVGLPALFNGDLTILKANHTGLFG